MPAPFDALRQAWQSQDREAALHRAVERLAADGVSRDVLDDCLGQLLDEVRATGGDEDAEETIAGVGDRLHGWCLPANAISTFDAFPKPSPVCVDPLVSANR